MDRLQEGSDATAVGLIREAEAVLSTAQRTAAELVLRAIEMTADRTLTGRRDEAVAIAGVGLTNGHQAGEMLVPLALSALASAAIRRGDLVAAAEHLERGQAKLAGAPPAVRMRLAWVAGQLVEARNGPAAALEGLADIYDSPPACRQLLRQEANAGGWLVRTALVAGERRRALAVVASAEQLAVEEPGMPALVAAAAHARGLLDSAPVALRRAATEHPDLWARSSAAEDLGTLVAGHGDGAYRQAAVQALEEALSGYESDGALRDVARVRGRLRRLGVRRRHWSSVARPASGWSSLTDVERAVADRVAEGLTNRQIGARMFLSPHTVAFHLRHIFRKLGITSRTELARLSVERRLEA